RLGRLDHAAGQGDTHGLELANRAHQALGATGARHQTELDFRLGETGGFTGDDDVAVHCQLAAAAQGEAVHRGDDRLRATADRVPQQLGVTVVHLDRRGGGEFLDVRASHEELLAAGQHDGANIIAARQLTEVLGQLVANRRIEGVLGFRTVDAHDGNAVGGKVQQDHWFVGLAHVSSGCSNVRYAELHFTTRRIIGWRTLLCKRYSSTLRLWSSQNAINWPLFSGKSAMRAALLNVRTAEYNFENLILGKWRLYHAAQDQGSVPRTGHRVGHRAGTDRPDGDHRG